MTALMIKMIAHELRGWIAAAIVITAFTAGMLIPGMWWTEKPITTPQPLNTVERIVENPHATQSIIPPGAIAWMNNTHCLTQCDGM